MDSDDELMVMISPLYIAANTQCITRPGSFSTPEPISLDNNISYKELLEELGRQQEKLNESEQPGC